jgi:putative CocE/NonD family hydrolase
VADDIVIAGEPRAHLRAALSTTDGNIVVRLHDVAPDGTSFVITTGWLRASHRTGHEQPALLTPGQPYDFEVALWPTHWRVAAGHRLRVSVSSGDVATVEPNAPPGTVTVLAGAGGPTVDVPLRRSVNAP